MVRGVAQSGSAPVLGTGGREFESRRPDHLLLRERINLPLLRHSPGTPHDSVDMSADCRALLDDLQRRARFLRHTQISVVIHEVSGRVFAGSE